MSEALSPALPRYEATVESVARSHVPLGVIVVLACLAQFMVILDETLVNVALPDMKTDLGLSTADQQWVVNGYMITLAGLLLLAARAGDLFGRKGVFQSGLLLFTAASLFGGLAQDPAWLLVARIVQGVGAAALAPSSLSLITASHPEGPARARALAIWSGISGAAAPIGLVLGGVLTSELSWRWVMFVNVPIGIGMLVAAGVALLPSRRHPDGGRLDLPGALTVTLGIGALVYGISEATTRGWGSAPVLSALAAAVVLLVAFVVIEARSQMPLMPLAIFRNRGLSVANIVIACVGAALTVELFFVSLYLQQVTGYSALRTGTAMIPMSAAMLCAVGVAKSMLTRVGPRTILVAGGVIATASLVWLSRLPVQPAYATHILGPTIFLGMGIGLMVLPISEAGTSGVDAGQAGLASGIFNVTRQLGGVIALAVLVTVATTVTGHSHLADPAAATVHGYRAALLICAAVVLVSAIVSMFLSNAPVAADAIPEHAPYDAADT